MKKILLTFDLEEFDIAEEYGATLDLATKIQTSYIGMERILALLKKYDAKATIFCTAFYAENAPEQLRRIADEGHEIASHGYYHDRFEAADLLKSRLKLAEITGKSVVGFRMARMAAVDNQAIEAAGYQYDSSLNPTWLPGRYNYLDKPRTTFNVLKNLKIIPASVTPILRFPLFWLSFKNLPLFLYKKMVERTLNKDGYVNIYVHPWEFNSLKQFDLPSYVKRVDDMVLLNKLERFIQYFKGKADFITIQEHLVSEKW
jgi:peptidoglycan/xylan/chitin deacetylase (PgdA/CDA1 family)